MSAWNLLWVLSAGACFTAWYILDGLPRAIRAGLASALGPITPAISRQDLWGSIWWQVLAAAGTLLAVHLIVHYRDGRLTRKDVAVVAAAGVVMVLLTAGSAFRAGHTAGRQLQAGDTDLGRLDSITRSACLITPEQRVTATLIGSPLDTPDDQTRATAIIKGRLTNMPITAYSPTPCP